MALLEFPGPGLIPGQRIPVRPGGENPGAYGPRGVLGPSVHPSHRWHLRTSLIPSSLPREKPLLNQTREDPSDRLRLGSDSDN